MMIQPPVAMIIGATAGTFSVIGYEYLTPYLRDKYKITDTCGVINLHGLPGLFAGLVCKSTNKCKHNNISQQSLQRVQMRIRAT
jgi:ammonia channel protein AmtB